MKSILFFAFIFVSAASFAQRQIPKTVADGIKWAKVSKQDSAYDGIIKANVIDTTNQNGNCVLYQDMFMYLKGGKFYFDPIAAQTNNPLHKKLIVVSYYALKPKEQCP